MSEQSDNAHAGERLLPREPIHFLTEPLSRFLHVEAAGGIALLICTLVALALANSPFSAAFLGFWKTHIVLEVGSFRFDHSLQHVINDGLMAIFFFVVGLEVKRELVLGELRDVQRAALPIAAAIGGMLAPAAIYLAIQYGEPGSRGWGIPMATDIAFVVGCLAVLGKRVPHGLRVMLLSLAIADDIGAILVIAIGYTDNVSLSWLAIAFAGVAVVFLLIRLGVRSLSVYAVVGAVVWFGFHESGVHATIAGVILGLMTPARSYLSEGAFARLLERAGQVFQGGSWSETTHRAEKVRRFAQAARETISPLEYLEKTLHPWVGFAIMPLFALANAGVPVQLSALGDPIAVAIMLGLVVGKPLGIMAFSALAVKLRVARLPEGVGWGGVLGGGCLAGIGFTMAIFIAGLALDPELLDVAKIGILAASTGSAFIGMGLLVSLLRPAPAAAEKDRR